MEDQALTEKITSQSARLCSIPAFILYIMLILSKKSVPQKSSFQNRKRQKIIDRMYRMNRIISWKIKH